MTTLTAVHMVILLLQIAYSGSLSNWMDIVDAKFNRSDPCDTIPRLNPLQKTMCQQDPAALRFVIQAINMSLAQCQQQFSKERWNCSLRSVKALTPVGTKETAFIYSIMSSAMVSRIARACATGNLTACSCGKHHARKRRRREEAPDTEPSHADWTWGGCSDNIEYGVKFSRMFVDAPEKIVPESSRTTKMMLNLHNTKLGRKTVSQGRQTKCRCHGVSGTCAVKICWNEVPSFHDVASQLKEQYIMNAVEISRKRGASLRPKDKKKKRSVNRLSLVFMKPSPNFCSANSALGIAGVSGRECNRTGNAYDSNSCTNLCCGHGYDTQVIKYSERCHCKFHWCCHVSCKTCHHEKEVYTCK